MENAAQRLIIALDDIREEKFNFVIEEARPFASTFKIGLALFIAHGPELVRRVQALGVQVFLDLKLHDIPMQVRKALESALVLSPRFLSVHAQAGRACLSEVAAIARKTCTKVVAVTVLTSFDTPGFHELGYDIPIADGAKRLADLSLSAGLDGLVCSPHELTTLRKEFGNEPYLICPGVRMKDDATDDQARVMSPREAILAGANALVVGRPITQAQNVLLKTKAMHREIDDALSVRADMTGSFL